MVWYAMHRPDFEHKNPSTWKEKMINELILSYEDRKWGFQISKTPLNFLYLNAEGERDPH